MIWTKIFGAFWGNNIVTLKEEFFRAIVAALVSVKPKTETLREVLKDNYPNLC